MEFVESLFTGGEYWKTAALVLGLGAGLAWAFTETIRRGALKYFQSKKKSEPWYWGSLLRGIATLSGGLIGLAVDLSMAALFASEESSGSSWLLSLLIGLFAGAFCAALVAVGKMLARKRGIDSDSMNFTWSTETPAAQPHEPLFNDDNEDPPEAP